MRREGVDKFTASVIPLLFSKAPVMWYTSLCSWKCYDQISSQFALHITSTLSGGFSSRIRITYRRFLMTSHYFTSIFSRTWNGILTKQLCKEQIGLSRYWKVSNAGRIFRTVRMGGLANFHHCSCAFVVNICTQRSACAIIRKRTTIINILYIQILYLFRHEKYSPLKLIYVHDVGLHGK